MIIIMIDGGEKCNFFIVSWPLNFRVHMSMRSAVRMQLHYLTSIQTGPQISLLFENNCSDQTDHSFLLCHVMDKN